jgi:hypothetical protein
MTVGLVLLYAQRDDGFMIFRIHESLSTRRAFPQVEVQPKRTCTIHWLLLSPPEQARPSNNGQTYQGDEKMKNLKNEGKTVEPKVRSSKSWWVLFALVLVAAFASLSVAGSAQVALADKGGVDGHTFTVTFTKWVTTAGTPPVLANMMGVVGGDVGAGTFTGEVLADNIVGNVENLEALYHFHGSRHSLTAHVYPITNVATGVAAIAGVVTEGWLEGARVTGEFRTLANCPIPTPGNMYGTVCFQGTLHIQRGDAQ